MDVLYFAYGSNLWIDQMIARVGWSRDAGDPPRIARLADHRLVFQRLEAGGDAYANIIPTPGDTVLGVVYPCQASMLDKLDHFEQGYARTPVTVADQHDNPLPAIAYVVNSATPVKFGRPSTEYLEKIVTGAKQHGLPQSYIQIVIATAHGAAAPIGE